MTSAFAGLRSFVHSRRRPLVLGTLTVGADGTGAAVFTVPASTSSGDHKIVLVLPGGSVEAALTVVAVDAAGPVTPGRTPTASGNGTPGGSMASTGADGTVAGALLAGLLLVGGCALTLTVRRRRLSADD